MEFRKIEIKKITMSDQPMPLLPKSIKEELKLSIKEKGVIYPILVEQVDDDLFKIIDGRNRWELSNELGLREIPCFVVDNEDPTVSVLKYDLEICRRSLTDDEREKFITQRDIYLNEIRERKLNKLIEKVIPELRDSVKVLFQRDSDIKVLMRFTELDPKQQKMFIKEVSGRINVNDLKSKVAEYQIHIEDLKKELKAKEEIEKKYQLLESGFAKQIEKKLKDKEVEIEAKYKDHSPAKLHELVKEAKNTIEAQFRDEIEEHRKATIEISKVKDEVSRKLLSVKEDLANTENELQRAQKLVAKFKIEKDNLQKALDNITSPDGLLKKLESIIMDIDSMSAKIDAICSEAMIACKGLASVKGSLNGRSADVREKIDKVQNALKNVNLKKANEIVVEMVKQLD